MKINKKKSGIIFYKKKKKKIKKDKEIMGYPEVDEYKYLGIWMDSKMTFERQYKETKCKIEKGIKMINIMKWKKCSAWKKTYA